MTEARDVGFAIGVLVGEGHFGGDGRQPHITLRMHIRHEATLKRVAAVFTGARLYGPYHHNTRQYYQLMLRGQPLREHAVPLIRAHRDLLDDHVGSRFDEMCQRYEL